MWARKGDVLCILMGCGFPVVLRRENDHYTFVGEAYVHSVAEGQAIGRGFGFRGICLGEV
jgi:hypothetical protein